MTGPDGWRSPVPGATILESESLKLFRQPSLPTPRTIAEHLDSERDGGVPVASCSGSGVFFSGPSPLGFYCRCCFLDLFFGILVRRLHCRMWFFRYHLSFWPTFLGHQVVRKEKWIRLHSTKGVIALFVAMFFSLKAWLVWLVRVQIANWSPFICH